MDAAWLLEAIAGYDPLEPSSVDRPSEHYASALEASTTTLRLGLIRHPYFQDLDPDSEAAVNAAIEVLAGISAGVHDVQVPYTGILMTIASAEAYAFHKPYLARTPQLYQAMTRQRLGQASQIPAADYVNARREMEQLRWTADSAFSNVDLLVTPTTALPPMSIESGYVDPPLPPDGVPIEMRNTQMFDVLGLPAISVPCGFDRDGMPIGLQIAGPRFSESRVLSLAHAYQQVTDWHTRSPHLA
jgi:aspartyl-tRNA(Asn)/glutamyl-tRNA(Gln) amidotransferase subunit A